MSWFAQWQQYKASTVQYLCCGLLRLIESDPELHSVPKTREAQPGIGCKVLTGGHPQQQGNTVSAVAKCSNHKRVTLHWRYRSFRWVAKESCNRL